jgi:DNA-binding transcriptional LysR family regulator
MDQLQAIRVFARVVEAGTFTKAADSMNMPKATVTKLIQSLEAHLRVKLLNRTTRRVTVTADGAAYYERTSRLLTELDEIDSSISNAQVTLKGRIRVDVVASVACQVVIPALCGFQKRYPDIQVDLGVDDRIVDLVADNVDCVIRGGDIIDESMVARRLGTCEFMTCATPAYVEHRGLPAHPREIENGHLLVGYFVAGSARIVPLNFNKEGVRIEMSGPYRVAVNDSNAKLTAGLAGLGIFQSARFSVAEHLAKGELVQVLPDWNCDSIPVHVVYPPNRHLSAKVRVFVEWMAEVFGGVEEEGRGASRTETANR